jgi:hypothetical protein
MAIESGGGFVVEFLECWLREDGDAVVVVDAQGIVVAAARKK